MVFARVWAYVCCYLSSFQLEPHWQTMSSLFILGCWRKIGKSLSLPFSPRLQDWSPNLQYQHFCPSPLPIYPYCLKTNGTKCCYFKDVVAKSKYVRLKVEVDKMQTIKTSLRQLATRPLQLKAPAVSWKSNSNFYSQRISNSQSSLTKMVDKYSNWIKLTIIFLI